MKSNNLVYKRVISFVLGIIMFLTFSVTPVQADSSEVKAKINSLITSFVPNIVENKVHTLTVSFTHPGIGMTKEMLDNMRDHVRAGDEPWASAFVQFSEYAKNKTSPTIRIQANNNDYVNIPSGGYPSIGYYAVRNMAQDADTAYSAMIMWYITGNDVYRKNAIGIIRNWSKVQSIGSIYDEQIRVSLGVFKLCFAAEILRYSTCNTTEYNWTSADTANFQQFLELTKSKYDRYTHFMNQHGFCTMGYIASAIFRNDGEDYTRAVQRTTTNPELSSNLDVTRATNAENRDGSILRQIRAVGINALTGVKVEPANIQLVEMGRDQGHAYADIGALSTLAMITICQKTKVDPVKGTITTAKNGVNLFKFLDDRILAGANYLCKYNLGNDVTYIPCYEANEKTYNNVSLDRGRIDNCIGIVYSYYKYIDKRYNMEVDEDTKYLSEAFGKIYPEGQSQDFLGDSVLLYTLDK